MIPSILAVGIAERICRGRRRGGGLRRTMGEGSRRLRLLSRAYCALQPFVLPVASRFLALDLFSISPNIHRFVIVSLSLFSQHTTLPLTVIFTGAYPPSAFSHRCPGFCIVYLHLHSSPTLAHGSLSHIYHNSHQKNTLKIYLSLS